MMMAVTSATTASVQLVSAILTAAEESDSPMSMMMGPMTTGGKSRVMKRVPKVRIRADMRK